MNKKRSELHRNAIICLTKIWFTNVIMSFVRDNHTKEIHLNITPELNVCTRYGYLDLNKYSDALYCKYVRADNTWSLFEWFRNCRWRKLSVFRRLISINKWPVNIIVINMIHIKYIDLTLPEHYRLLCVLLCLAIWRGLVWTVLANLVKWVLSFLRVKVFIVIL